MAKPNIVLITLDALRADHLGCYGYRKDTSPFIDKVARRGVMFRRAYSTGSATPQSFPGIMASTYPLDFGGYSRISEERTLVSEVLQKAGYRTMGFHSNAYLSSYFGYGRGWDVFRHLNHFDEVKVRPAMQKNSWQAWFAKKLFDRRSGAKVASKWGITDFFAGLAESFLSTARKIYLNVTRPIPAYYTAFEMNEAVKKELSGAHVQKQKPVFLWVHYMDAHDPYGLFLRKNGFWGKFQSYLGDYLITFFGEYPMINKLFNPLYKKMYDEGIRHIDSALDELFIHLSDIGILNDDAFVFITADHGEEFGENNGYMHMQKAFNENLRVPLIVLAPKKFAAEPGINETTRSLIDLSPTILAAAGVKNPKSFRGKNLFDNEPRDVIAELTGHEPDLSGIRRIGQMIIRAGHKFIKIDSRKMLFSLDDEREETNLAEQEKDTVLSLEKKLEQIEYL